MRPSLPPARRSSPLHGSAARLPGYATAARLHTRRLCAAALAPRSGFTRRRHCWRSPASLPAPRRGCLWTLWHWPAARRAPCCGYRLAPAGRQPPLARCTPRCAATSSQHRRVLLERARRHHPRHALLLHALAPARALLPPPHWKGRGLLLHFGGIYPSPIYHPAYSITSPPSCSDNPC